MTLPLSVHGATDRGLVHETNEDAWAVLDTDEGGRLLVVCDGMGGMGRGDEASKLAIEALQEEVVRGAALLPPERLRAAIRVADEAVRDRLCSDGLGLPGSTAVLVYVMDGAAHVAWVGDSRAYLVRDGAVVERTRDHKLIEELVDAGQLTHEDARKSTLAHVVTRALGGRSPDEPVVKPATLDHPWKLRHGDRIVLCSDGVCDLVDDDEVADLVDDTEAEAATAALVREALDRGGHDNITTIVAVWEGPSWIEEDQATPVMVGRRTDMPDLRVHRSEAWDDLEAGGRITEEIDLDALERQSVEDGLRSDPTLPIEDEDEDEDDAMVEPITTEDNTDTLLADAAGALPTPTARPPEPPPVRRVPSPLERVSTHAALLVALLSVLTAAWWLLG